MRVYFWFVCAMLALVLQSTDAAKDRQPAKQGVVPPGWKRSNRPGQKNGTKRKSKTHPCNKHKHWKCVTDFKQECQWSSPEKLCVPLKRDDNYGYSDYSDYSEDYSEGSGDYDYDSEDYSEGSGDYDYDSEDYSEGSGDYDYNSEDYSEGSGDYDYDYSEGSGDYDYDSEDYDYDYSSSGDYSGSDYSGSDDYSSGDKDYSWYNSDGYDYSEDYSGSSPGYSGSDEYDGYYDYGGTDYSYSGSGDYGSGYYGSGGYSGSGDYDSGDYGTEYDSGDYGSDGYSSEDGGGDDGEFPWKHIPCTEQTIYKEGTLVAEPGSHERRCWSLKSEEDTFIQMWLEVEPMQGVPWWACLEPFHEESIKREIITARNSAPPEYWWHEAWSNRLFKTCQGGTYGPILTTKNSAFLRMQKLPDSSSRGFSVHYEVLKCYKHPTDMVECRAGTAYPTPAPVPGVTKFPTTQPTKPRPTKPPTIGSCESLGNNHDGWFEHTNYDSHEGLCWNAARPNGLSAEGSMQVTVDVADVERDSSSADECHDKVYVFSMFRYRVGKVWYNKKIAAFGGKPLCGRATRFQESLPLKTVVEHKIGTTYPAALTAVRFEFTSDSAISGDGFSVSYNWGADEERDLVVTSFTELKQAVMRAKVDQETFISINADTIYFDDSWDFRVPKGKNLRVAAAYGRSRVVFDGSRRTRPVYGGNESLVSDPVPQIVDVRDGGILSLEKIHFRFFRAQHAAAKDAVGLVHVQAGGTIERIADCRFSSNDARPFYSDDDIANQVFPKGALIQVEPQGVINDLFDTAFRHNLHTSIANRGQLHNLHDCTFAFNAANMARHKDDGAAIAVPGAVVANSRNVHSMTECSFASNDAQSRFYENSRRVVNQDTLFVYDPVQQS